MPTVVPCQRLDQYINRTLEAGDWLELDQPQINQFADVTLDTQYIHTDPERAAQTPFGGTIAHGLLSLSLLPYLTESCSIVPEGTVMGVNYGFNKVRFLSPVKPGDSVRAQSKVLAVKEKEGGRYLITVEVTVDIKGQTKPALVAEWINMFVCT